MVTAEELVEWSKNGDFYIFGHGQIAQAIFYTFFEKEENFAGFVTSKQAENSFLISEIPNDSRIVIGVIRTDIIDEVLNSIPSTMERMILWDYSGYYTI